MIRNHQSNHVYHHNVSDGPKIAVKVEKNSRGYNFEVSVSGAGSVDEALALVREAESKLAAQFAQPTA